MKKYKVCILAAGVGSRMGSLTQNVNKAVLPINFKAVISHIIEKFDKDIEIVIAVGHKKETVIDYIEMAHPDRKIEFVEVDKYVGPGTGPGYSLLACKELLRSPFIFFAADTIVLEDIPSLEKNWFGISPVKNPEQYCTVRIKDNLVVQIDDKISTNNKFAFIGLAGIKDYKIFFNSLETNKEPISGEIQVSNGFKSLLERKLEPVGFTWFDTGTLENFSKTNNHLSGDDSKFDFSKGDEFLFFVENKVIKFFADEEIAKNRVSRSKLLNDLTPQINSHKNNYYCYEKIDGDVLYDVMNEGLVSNFLEWCNSNLWDKKNLDQESSNNFKKACKSFYQDKTNKRLKVFYSKIPINDTAHIINGKEVPSQSELFNKVDWNLIFDGIPSGFHGDLQFDNVLFKSEENSFKLLDWRQDFGGLLEYGDLYYDLSKLYGGMNLSYKSIKRNKFSFDMSGNKVFYNYEMSSTLIEAKEVFEDFVIKNGYNLEKIRFITGLIYLNMAPLHHDPFDHLLYFLGKNMIFKELQKRKG
jgi:NDP-sugar pyrophosphorylase family protein